MKRRLFPLKMIDVLEPSEETKYYACDWGTKHEMDKDCKCECGEQIGCGMSRFWEIIKDKYEDVHYNNQITEEMQDYVMKECKE